MRFAFVLSRSLITIAASSSTLPRSSPFQNLNRLISDDSAFPSLAMSTAAYRFC